MISPERFLSVPRVYFRLKEFCRLRSVTHFEEVGVLKPSGRASPYSPGELIQYITWQHTQSYSSKAYHFLR